MDELERARDEWLALRCQAREHGALEDLIQHMERPLSYFIWKLVGDREIALEVIQELWIKTSKTIHTLREPRSVRSWLYQLARGTALDRIRHENRRIEVEQYYQLPLEDSTDPDPLDGFEPVDIQRALDRLEPGHREVVTLHFLDDFPIREIAEIVGIPEGTVKSRLHYGKKALKQQLSKGKLNG